MIGGPHVYCLRRWHLGDRIRRARRVPDGPLGDRDLPRHPLASPATLVGLGPTEKMRAAAAGRLPLKRPGPGGFGRIRPVKKASCLARANSHAACKPPTNERHADEIRSTRDARDPVFTPIGARGGRRRRVVAVATARNQPRGARQCLSKRLEHRQLNPRGSGQMSGARSTALRNSPQSSRSSVLQGSRPRSRAGAGCDREAGSRRP
jgi:hypothetical protein